jgi:hypothetical protein
MVIASPIHVKQSVRTVRSFVVPVSPRSTSVELQACVSRESSGRLSDAARATRAPVRRSMFHVNPGAAIHDAETPTPRARHLSAPAGFRPWVTFPFGSCWARGVSIAGGGRALRGWATASATCPKQPGYHRRLVAATDLRRDRAPPPAVSVVGRPAWPDQLRLLDARPVPCGTSRRTVKRSQLAVGLATGSARGCRSLGA